MMKKMVKRCMTLLAAAVMMILCSMATLAAEECPLTLFGQKPVPTEDEASFDMIVLKNVYFSTIVVAGTDRIEDSDLQITNGEIIEKKLNTDNGKLPELDVVDTPSWSPYGGQAGSVDFLQIKNTDTGNYWYIAVYRISEEISAIDELRDYKKFVIYTNGYQLPELGLGWQTNKKGDWYHYGNGLYPAKEWKEIDGKWYFFNHEGYIQKGTWTEDGYYLDSTGAWVPGYDEDLVEGATVSYKRWYYNENMWPMYDTITVPVSKASDVNRIYDNLAENEIPGLDRGSAIYFNSYTFKEDMAKFYR